MTFQSSKYTTLNHDELSKDSPPSDGDYVQGPIVGLLNGKILSTKPAKRKIKVRKEEKKT